MLKLSQVEDSEHPALSRSTSVNLSNTVVAAVGVERPQHALADLFEHKTSSRNSLRLVIGAIRNPLHTWCTLDLIFCSSKTGSPNQATTPRVIVHIGHCVVQHEQSFQAPQDRTATRVHTYPSPCSSRSPLPRTITHPLRRASISRTSVPAAAAVLTLALATAMPTIVEPLPHGEAPSSLGTADPHRPTCRGYITPPASFDSPTSAASNTSFAFTSTPAPPPPLRAPSAYTGTSSLLAS
ncbi:hypothetical protein B0H14DRAFT_3516356 [Mycena olivaceomarginata]|nr:hypothetical protein B0H14DRAFT_3516356 [Mycena olivaceomarginata]